MKRTSAPIVAAVLASVAGLALWWTLRSEDVDAPPAAEAPVVDPPKSKPHIARRRAAAPTATVEPAAPATPSPVPAVTIGATGRLVVRVVECETARPVAGVDVYAADAAGREYEAKADAAGVANFAAVPSPTVDVLVETPGFVRELVTDVEVAADGVRDCAVELKRGVAVEGVVLGADGRPLPGASAMATEELDDWLDESVTPFAEARAGADGSFRLAWLPKDRWSFLHFVAPGHAVLTMRWHPTADGRVVARLALVGVLRGVVREPSGRPAADAEVVAKTDAEVAMPVQSARTDARGRFAFDELATGSTWTVIASKSGFVDSLESACVVLAPSATDAAYELVLRQRPRIDVVVLDPDGAPVESAEIRWGPDGTVSSSVQSDASGRATIDLATAGRVWIGVDAPKFAPSERTVFVAEEEARSVEFRLDAGVAIEGVVVDDLGAPVPGAEVCVDGGFSVGTGWSRSGVSRIEGAFRVTGLTAGPHKVHVDAEHRETWWSLEQPAPYAGLRVVMPREARLTMRLRHPPGTAAPESVAVVMSSVDVVASSVPISEERDTPAPVGRRFAWSDADVTVWIPAGRWKLRFYADEFVTATRDVELSPDRETSLGEIELDPGLAVSGIVVDDIGDPVPNAYVRLVIDRGGVKDDGLPEPPDAYTGADGKFRFTAIERTARAADVSAQVDISRESVALAGVKLPCGPLRLVMRRNGVVAFHARGPDGAAPPESACVVVDGRLNFEIRPNGDFEASLPAGERALLVQSSNYLPARRVVEVAPGVVTRMPEFVLDPGLTLVGRVIDADGRPIAGAGVGRQLPDRGLDQPRVTVTDEAGAFAIEHLPPETGRFAVWANGFASTIVSLAPRTSAEPVVVTLHRGALVHGTVRGATPESTKGIDLEARRAGEDPQSAGLGDDGSFSVRLVAGHWSIVATRGDTALATREVDVREGDDVRLDITL